MSYAPKPGHGWRLMLPMEIIDRGDEWTITTHIGWGMARNGDVGRTVIQARVHSSYGPIMYYRRKLSDEGPRVLCGCGNHDVDPNGDPYAQHRDWAESEGPGDL